VRLVQFTKRAEPGEEPRLGVWREDGRVAAVREATSMRAWIERTAGSGDPAGLNRALADYAEELYEFGEVRLEAPIHNPEKMIFVGLNYYDHAAESNMAVPEVPVLFPKYANSIVGPEDDVIIPEEVSQCDYEVELAVVIGRKTKRVSPAEAMEAVFGYTIVNDVSARDIQLAEGQWTRGKAIDTFAPIGPCIVTKDAIADPGELDLSLILNGSTMQLANTRDLIFDIPYLISFLSRTMTLMPGDIVSTGTPPGVGLGRKPPVWLEDGDVTEARVQGIGSLRNRYVREPKGSAPRA
jgi:2-keto-4-pentenoate hydratase/2-oxohepta-3-ene-1,7-dioic acid hydratase in catechol pathway